MTKKDRILELFKEAGVLRPRDLEAVGISGVDLNKLYAEGLRSLLGHPACPACLRRVRSSSPGRGARTDHSVKTTPQLRLHPLVIRASYLPNASEPNPPSGRQ